MNKPVFESEELIVERLEAGYLVTVRGVASFHVASDGSGLELRDRGAAVSDELVDIARTHWILPRLHQLRGLPTLHGSAVCRGDGACVFLGMSGAGKSTLATFLSDGGALLADDAILLRRHRGKFVVMPTASHTRLRDGSADRFGATFREASPWSRFLMPLPQANEARLARMYCIDSAPNVFLRRIRGREALLELTRFVHRLDPSEPRLLTRELELLESLSQTVPIARLGLPADFAALPDVRALIDHDLSFSSPGESS